MENTMLMLENTFMSAYRTGASYVAIRIRFLNMGMGDEVIINPHQNILSKLEYYKNAYTDKLELKSNPNIKIISVAYGNTFKEIESLL